MLDNEPSPEGLGQAHEDQKTRHMRVAWVATAFTLASYFCLMLLVALSPTTLTKPVVDGGVITLGLVFGVSIILVLIIIAVAFTVWNNKVDQRA